MTWSTRLTTAITHTGTSTIGFDSGSLEWTVIAAKRVVLIVCIGIRVSCELVWEIRVCNTVQTLLVQSLMQEFSQQLWCLMFDFCARFFHHYSVKHISTNLTNYLMTYKLSMLCRFVNDWFQTQRHFSKERKARQALYVLWFFIIKSTFLPRYMQCRRGSDENAACLSVCKTRDLWQNGRKICPIFISYERSFSLEEWLVRATPPTWNFGSTGPRWSEIADFQPIFARNSSAVRPS